MRHVFLRTSPHTSAPGTALGAVTSGGFPGLLQPSAPDEQCRLQQQTPGNHPDVSQQENGCVSSGIFIALASHGPENEPHFNVSAGMSLSTLN